MTPPDKEQLKRMSRRAYVDRQHGKTKVIFGDDEWQIEFKITNAIEGKKKIATGEFDIKNVVPAEIDVNVQNIRNELAKLSTELVAIYEKAPKKGGFIKYNVITKSQTDKITYEMMNIKTYGLLNERKTP